MKIPRSSRRRHKGILYRRRRPINVLASVMTTMNLYCGAFSIFASIGQEFDTAAIYILAAIVFDMLDGTVARLTRSASDFGKELDSLCDVVSFGVAPCVLIFMAYLPAQLPGELSTQAESIAGKTGSYMAIIYVVCAALRLARYNTFQAEQRGAFTGLPSPAAGGTLASLVLFLDYYEVELGSHRIGAWAYYSLGPIAVLLALLMVSTVRYPKERLKTFVLAPRNAIISLAFFAFGLAIIHYAWTTSPSIVLFPLTAAYVLYGLVSTAYLRLFRGVRHEPAPEMAPDNGREGAQAERGESSPAKRADRL